MASARSVSASGSMMRSRIGSPLQEALLHNGPLFTLRAVKFKLFNPTFKLRELPGIQCHLMAAPTFLKEYENFALCCIGKCKNIRDNRIFLHKSTITSKIVTAKSDLGWISYPPCFSLYWSAVMRAE